MESKPVFGIDLGTTYSCIAYVDEHGRPIVAPNSENALTTPSVVYFESGNNIVVGQIAKDTAEVYPDLIVQTVKRHMGDANWSRSFHGRDYRPQDVSALILGRRCEGSGRPDPCIKLATFHGCGYRKSACSCAVPTRLPQCIVPELPMRNGNLAQAAAALYLFLRDVCGGDLIGWIDDHLSQSNEPNAAPIIEALRHIHGVSDKVLSLAFVTLLLGGRPRDSRWQSAGARLIVIDTLVHNWLHRTGILNDLDARHFYGPKCYGPDGCAAILRRAALQIDARRYGADNPPVFPRLIQYAIWRFCAADAFDICNGNRIDDRKPCSGAGCPIIHYCGRLALRVSTVVVRRRGSFPPMHPPPNARPLKQCRHVKDLSSRYALF